VTLATALLASTPVGRETDFALRRVNLLAAYL
jgi:hypothetical protein